MRLTFAVKKFLAVLARKGEGFGKLAHKLYNLCNVIIIFAIPRSGGRVEEVVASYYLIIFVLQTTH